MKRLLFFVVLIACHHPPAQTPPDAGTERVWPPVQARDNPIPAENQKTGDPDWLAGKTSWNHQVEGYLDRVSAEAGDSVNAQVSTDSAHAATWTLFRVGWYGGAGARRSAGGSAQLNKQAACPNDAVTGLVRCAWTPSFSFAVPNDAVSGLFVVRVQRDDGYATWLPLIVRDERPADLLFQASVNTWQAYNAWGGESLYADADDHLGFALEVSFDRPYQGYSGAGHLLRWEQYMAHYLERYGYDVTYTTDLDIAREGASAIVKRGAYLSVGHDEYWSGEQRDAANAARDAGVPLYFFGANPAYWKVRLSDPGAGGNARVITCYKKDPARDPMAGTPQQTGRYRDPAINEPEENLVGVMYEGWVLFDHPWVVADASNALFEGTGLANGDALPLRVGYEYDRNFLKQPGVQIVAHSPVVDAESKPGFSDSAIYTAPSGALVFGAGTIDWVLALDGPQRDARVERITANLFKMGLRLPVPQALESPGAPASPTPDAAWGGNVSTVASGMEAPAGVARLPDGSFLVADARAHRILRVDGSDITPYAGDGNNGGEARYDNVPALQARFYQPTSVLADANGNVYVADTHNHAIRKIANDAAHTVSTIAGALAQAAYADGAGGAARFDDPMGLAWQDATHILVADSANMAIRVLDLTSGAVRTLAGAKFGDEADGPASSAVFFYPTAVAAADDGRVFFVASSTGKLKCIGADAAHTVTTLVAGGQGYADGAGGSAQLLAQGGLVWDGSALLVADAGNQRIRRVVPGADAASTRVYTFAGSGKVGVSDGAASTAAFSLPLGLFRTSDGTLYVADGSAGSLRSISP